MKKFVILLSVLLICGSVNSATNFGIGFKKICNQGKCALTLDFNGDGITDSLAILEVSEKFKLDKNCQQIKLTKRTKAFHSERQIVIGFYLSQKGKADYLPYIVFDHAHFSTPIWQTTPLPINIIVRDSAEKIIGKNIRGDMLSLGTEAGIDIFLFWNGTNFELFEPKEEP